MRRIGLVLCCVALLVVGVAGCAGGSTDTYKVGYLASQEVITLASATATALSHSVIPVLNENETPGLIISGTGLVMDQLGAWTFKPSSCEFDYIPLPLRYLMEDMGASTGAPAPLLIALPCSCL